MLQSDVQFAAADVADQTLFSAAREQGDRYGEGTMGIPKSYRQGAPFLVDQRGIERVHSGRKSGDSGGGDAVQASQQRGRAVYGQAWNTQGSKALLPHLKMFHP